MGIKGVEFREEPSKFISLNWGFIGIQKWPTHIYRELDQKWYQLGKIKQGVKSGWYPEIFPIACKWG